MQNSFIYLIIISLSSMIAFYSQKSVLLNGERIFILKKPLFFLAFLIAWLPLAFTRVGVDYNNYIHIAHIVKWDNYNDLYGLESGFNIILLVLKTIFKSENIALFGVKTLTMTLFCISLYLQREKLNVGYSFSAYMILIYLPSFYLLSSCLASTIILLAVSIWRSGRKKWIALILLFLACTIHDSVKIIIPLILMIIILIKSKAMTSLWKASLLLGVLFSALSASYIFKYVAEHSSSFHYNNYNVSNSSGTGLLFFVFYVPIVVYSLYITRFEKNSELKYLTYVSAIGILLFRYLAYQFVVVERIEYLLMSLYIFCIPEELSKKETPLKIQFSKKPLETYVFIIILMLKGFMVYNEFVNEKTGLIPYTTYNPFI